MYGGSTPATFYPLNLNRLIGGDTSVGDFRQKVGVLYPKNKKRLVYTDNLRFFLEIW